MTCAKARAVARPEEADAVARIEADLKEPKRVEEEWQTAGKAPPGRPERSHKTMI
jgi:hypothetical protein